MSITALARAKTVLASNKYFALATVDESGPWVATLAYTIGPPNCLYFFSEKTSRHGQALLNGSVVAGVIYNSQCSASDAESIQFSGIGELAHNKETITFVLGLSATQDQVAKSLQNTSTLLFRVSISDAFVLDQELFSAKGIDGRESVSVKDVFSGIDIAR